jgi:hypothetical protein
MKILHTISLIFTFFLIGNDALSQDSLQRKHLILKISPLTIFDIDNTLQIATEHNLSKNMRWTLSEELGYGAGSANVWAYNSNNNSYGPNREVYRVKIEARRYNLKKNRQMAGGYMAYELFYKQVNDIMNRTIGRECDGGPCNYFEEVNYSASKYVVGGTVKFGYQTFIRNENKKNTKFVFDFYVGLGLRRVMIDHRIDGDVQNNTWFFGNNGIFTNGGLGYRDNAYNIPHAALGIRLGYLLF